MEKDELVVEMKKEDSLYFLFLFLKEITMAWKDPWFFFYPVLLRKLKKTIVCLEDRNICRENIQFLNNEMALAIGHFYERLIITQIISSWNMTESLRLCICVCVCVCVRERERDELWKGLNSRVNKSIT